MQVEKFKFFKKCVGYRTQAVDAVTLSLDITFGRRIQKYLRELNLVRDEPGVC